MQSGSEFERRVLALLLTALALFLPWTAAFSPRGSEILDAVRADGQGRGSQVRENPATGFNGQPSGDIMRLLQGIDECTEDTSVGDAEAGIAIYEDEEACDREDPLVGCNVMNKTNCRLCVTNGGSLSEYLPTCPDYVQEYIEEIYPQTAETPSPATTLAPGATTAPAATLSPGATTAPVATLAPGATIAPAATLAPGATTAPAATLAPGATTAPATTLAPGATIAPAATLAPGATTAPATTLAPGATIAPAATLAPGATIAPAATLAPGATIAPAATLAPGATIAPAATLAPGETLAPNIFTLSPSATPSSILTGAPTATPTGAPSEAFSVAPTASPTAAPTSLFVETDSEKSLVATITITSDEPPVCSTIDTCEDVAQVSLGTSLDRSDTLNVTSVTVTTVTAGDDRRLLSLNAPDSHSASQGDSYYLRASTGSERHLQSDGEDVTETKIDFISMPVETSELTGAEQAAEQINALFETGITNLLEELGLPTDSEVDVSGLKYAEFGSISDVSDDWESLSSTSSSDGISDTAYAGLAVGLVVLVVASLLCFCCVHFFVCRYCKPAKKGKKITAVPPRAFDKEDDKTHEEDYDGTDILSQFRPQSISSQLSIPHPAGDGDESRGKSSPFAKVRTRGFMSGMLGSASGSTEDLETGSHKTGEMPSVKEEDVFVYSSSSTIRGGALPEDPDEDIEKTDEIGQTYQVAATSVAESGAPWFFRKPRRPTDNAGSAADAAAEDERMPSPLSGESIVGTHDSSEVSAFSMETKHHQAEERPPLVSPAGVAFGIVAREIEAREKKARDAMVPVTARQPEEKDDERKVQTRAAVAAGVAAAGVAVAGATVAAMADEKKTEDRTKQQEESLVATAEKKLPERERMRGVAVKGQPPQLSEFLTGTQENYSMHSMQTLASVPEEGSPIGSSMTGYTGSVGTMTPRPVGEETAPSASVGRIRDSRQRVVQETPAAAAIGQLLQGRPGSGSPSGSSRSGSSQSSITTVRGKPLIAADRSESSGSESSVPSPYKLPPQVPHVVVSTSGSGGVQVPERESMRSTSSAGSILAGIAVISSAKSTDSLALSPESSPLKNRSPVLPTLRETLSEKYEAQTPESRMGVSDPDPNVVAPGKDDSPSEDTTAKDVPPVEIAGVARPVPAILAYSPVQGPSDSPPRTISPFKRTGMTGSPGEEEPVGLKLSVLPLTAKQVPDVAPTPRVSHGRGGGFVRTMARRIESSSEAESMAVSSSTPPSSTRASRHEGAVSGRGGSDTSDFSPDNVSPSFDSQGPGVQQDDGSSTSPVSSRVSRPLRRVGSTGSMEGSISSLTRQGTLVWEEEGVSNNQPPPSPATQSARTESTQEGQTSSSSAAASAESAAASASRAADSASIAASAAREAADQARVGIWSAEAHQQQHEHQPQIRRQPPRSAMARSAAAAGAAAAAAASAAKPHEHERRAESKGAFRVRDPGMLRIPSSQSTEAPTSKSISYVAPSPDGAGSYIFSGGFDRAFGSRRPSSGSYPSFGLSSSGVESGGNFSDNESSGEQSTPSPSENKSTSMVVSTPVQVPRITGTLSRSGSALAVDTGSSSDSSSTTRRHEPESVASIADQPFIDQTLSAAGRSLVAPSHAAGAGDLFALGPSQVEHQRRARDSRRRSSSRRAKPSARLESGREIEGSGEREFGCKNDVEEVSESSSRRGGNGGGIGSQLRNTVSVLSSVFTGSGAAGSGGKRRLPDEIQPGAPEAKKMMATSGEGVASGTGDEAKEKALEAEQKTEEERQQGKVGEKSPGFS